MSNANLLEVVNFDDTVKNTRQGRVQPQMMEFQVNSELAPFLVSSTRAVLWVESAGSSDNVRAAIRARRGLETELLAAVVEMSERCSWGNTQPLSTMGIKNCVDHLQFYGLEQVEVLVAKDTDVTGIDFKKLRVVEANWVPVDAAVVVPVDRGFVGTLGTVGQHKALALIHNASRGLAVAYRSENHESVARTSA
jgi:hypothetical protein